MARSALLARSLADAAFFTAFRQLGTRTMLPAQSARSGGAGAGRGAAESSSRSSVVGRKSSTHDLSVQIADQGHANEGEFGVGVVDLHQNCFLETYLSRQS